MVAAQALAWPEELALAAAAGVATLLRVVVLLSGYTLPAWNTAAGGGRR